MKPPSPTTGGTPPPSPNLETSSQMALEDDILKLARTVRQLMPSAHDFWVPWRRLALVQEGAEEHDVFLCARAQLPGMARWFALFKERKVKLTEHGLRLADADAEELTRLRAVIAGKLPSEPATTDRSHLPALSEEGFLSSRGYHAGKDAPTASERQATLRAAYETASPSDQFNPSYVADWGQPGSLRRVEKIARSIAAFSRNRKASLRRQGMTQADTAQDEAVSDWEEDLAWLQSEFFDGDFRWPSTT
ncbi:MAG: hypothetical protein HYZ53_08595 [Planctomycetes bacterium]|nr:hypothetical protein [Planctomycetota bacterium]